MNMLTVQGENSDKLSILKEAQGERNGKVGYNCFINHSLFSEWRMELCLLSSLKCMVLVLVPMTGQLCDLMMLRMLGEGTIYAGLITDVLLTAPCLYTTHLGQLECAEQKWRPKVPEIVPHLVRRAFFFHIGAYYGIFVSSWHQEATPSAAVGVEWRQILFSVHFFK